LGALDDELPASGSGCVRPNRFQIQRQYSATLQTHAHADTALQGITAYTERYQHAARAQMPFAFSLELGIIDSNRFGRANQISAKFDSTHQFPKILKPSSVGKLVFLRADCALTVSLCHELSKAQPVTLS